MTICRSVVNNKSKQHKYSLFVCHRIMSLVLALLFNRNAQVLCATQAGSLFIVHLGVTVFSFPGEFSSFESAVYWSKKKIIVINGCDFWVGKNSSSTMNILYMLSEIIFPLLMIQIYLLLI